jgi:transaldolase
MKLFLDTANVAMIEQWAERGLIDGVTTNPTLLSKEKGDPVSIIRQICSIMKAGEVSVEVTERDPAKVLAQARQIAQIAKNVVVKIPCHPDYCTVIESLLKEGIKINVTLVFSLLQGLMMCKLGAQYISPFIGRLDEVDEDGVHLIGDLRQMIDEYVFLNTKIIAASIRHVRHLHEVVLLGSDVATVPPVVLEQAFLHPLTDRGMEQFLEDWKKLGIRKFP